MSFGESLRFWLVAPAIVAAIAFAWGFFVLPPRSPWLMEVIVIDFVAGFIELVAATVAVTRLIQMRANRSHANLICTSVGLLPAMLFIVWYLKSLY